jgi:hypothetical protein
LFKISSLLGQTAQELDSLTKVLEAIYEKDQVPRTQMDSIQNKYGYNSSQVREQWRLIEKNDSANIEIVASILETYGWLSESKTSKVSNSALFLVVQHAPLDVQEKYANTLRKAAKEGKLKPNKYAYFLDRVNMKQGKFQIYGSQISVSTNGKSYFYPIKDEPNVNKRRKKVGLPPLEEVAHERGFVYNLPSKDALKNRLVVTGFVIGSDQTPIKDASIKFGSNVVTTTNSDGFYMAVIEKELLKEQFTVTREGYIISDPPLKDEGKEVYDLSIMLTKKSAANSSFKK